MIIKQVLNVLYVKAFNTHDVIIWKVGVVQSVHVRIGDQRCSKDTEQGYAAEGGLSWGAESVFFP